MTVSFFFNNNGSSIPTSVETGAIFSNVDLNVDSISLRLAIWSVKDEAAYKLVLSGVDVYIYISGRPQNFRLRTATRTSHVIISRLVSPVQS